MLASFYVLDWVTKHSCHAQKSGASGHHRPALGGLICLGKLDSEINIKQFFSFRGFVFKAFLVNFIFYDFKELKVKPDQNYFKNKHLGN